MMKEYKYLQTIIDKVDGQRFQIRNWTIVAAGFLFTASISTKIPLIAFAGVVATLFFAFLEIIYMQMLDDVIKRNNQLERLIDTYRCTGEEPDGYVFGVGQAFVGTFSFKKIPHTIFTSSRIHVTAFYLGLVIVTAAGAIAVALH